MAAIEPIEFFAAPLNRIIPSPKPTAFRGAGNEGNRTMRNGIKAALAGLAVMAACGNTASAANSEKITIYNNTSGAVWVTIYTAIRTGMTSGCVAANSTKVANLNLTDMTSTWGGIYVRFEYKQNANCTGRTNYDSKYGGLIGLATSGTMNIYVPAR